MYAYLAIFTTIALFSTIEVVIKLINNNIDLFLLAFVRFFVSGLILLCFGYVQQHKDEKVKGITLFKIILLGVFGISIGLGSFHFSMEYIKASTGAVIFSMNPIFSAITAFVILNESLHFKNIFGMILGLIGVYILSFGFNAIDVSSLVGVGAMLLSAIVFGTYIVLSKKYIAKYGTFMVTGIGFASGALLFLPFVKSYRVENIAFTISILSYITILATTLAYALYFYGLKRVPVSVGASMFYLKPILASILAVCVLSEKLLYNFYIGLALILFGLLLTNSKKRVKEEL